MHHALQDHVVVSSCMQHALQNHVVTPSTNIACMPCTNMWHNDPTIGPVRPCLPAPTLPQAVHYCLSPRRAASAVAVIAVAVAAGITPS